MRIALCQFTAGQDKQQNLQAVTRWIEDAAAQGAELIVLPEYAMYTPLEPSLEILEQAETLDGEFVTALRKTARDNSIYVVSNVFELSGTDRPFNTSVVITDEGELHGFYRKVHMYDAFNYRESEHLSESDDPQPLIFSLGGFNIGVQICYDLRFPEWARTYVDQGANVLLYSAAWPGGPRKEDHWKTMLRSRAIENTVYVAGVVQGPPLAIGGTMLVDPFGSLDGELTYEDGLIVRDISLDRVGRVRELNPSLANRVM